jgi:Ca2+-transporting ATPase
MRRPPRDPGAAVITRRMWYGTAVAASVMAAGTLLVLDAGLPGGLIEGGGGIERARTMTFNTLVLYQLFDAFCVHSDTESALRALLRNHWVWIAVAASLALQGLVIHAPPLQRAFGTVAIGAGDWLVCIAVASTVVLAREGVKGWWRRADRRAAVVQELAERGSP